jgi:hypothetical protein
MLDDFDCPQYQATGYGDMPSKNSWKIEILAYLARKSGANNLELTMTQKKTPLDLDFAH